MDVEPTSCSPVCLLIKGSDWITWNKFCSAAMGYGQADTFSPTSTSESTFEFDNVSIGGNSPIRNRCGWGTPKSSDTDRMVEVQTSPTKNGDAAQEDPKVVGQCHEGHRVGVLPLAILVFYGVSGKKG